MSVKIRMKRMGSKKRPFYRIVATDSRSPRDGRFIEELGYYDPMADPATISIDQDRLFKRLDDGAIVSGNVKTLMSKLGLVDRWMLLRSGVEISQLDAKIEELRAKQPQAKPKEKKRISKKAAAAKAAAEAKAKGEEGAKKESDSPKGEQKS